jgi:hypothetical protein
VSVRTVAAVALALGIVLLFSLVTLALFFAAGGPFGALNDWSIGVSGVLAAAFVLAIRSSALGDAFVRGVILPAVAVVGAVLVVVGAWLVISDTTGFLLAGLVESFGFALFGCWLIALSRSMATIGQWPRPLPTLGYATGILLVVGLIVAPGIVMRFDDMDAAPWWVWVGFVGWLGIFVLLPIWSIWLGIAARRASPVSPRTEAV